MSNWNIAYKVIYEYIWNVTNKRITNKTFRTWYESILHNAPLPTWAMVIYTSWVIYIISNSVISPCSNLANMFHITGPFRYGCWYFVQILSSRRPIISFFWRFRWNCRMANKMRQFCTLYMCVKPVFLYISTLSISIIASRNAFLSITLYELLLINSSEYS